MKKWGCIVAGILVANLTGLAAIGICWLIGRLAGPHALTAALYPSVLLMPIAMGVAASFFWARTQMGVWAELLATVAAVAFGCGGAYLVLKEGTICILIASPILLGAMFAGVMIGRVIFRPRNGTKLQLSLLPLLLLAAPAELLTRTDYTDSVADEIVIRAPAATVFKHVTAFSPIEEAPDFWLFKLGLPSPSCTTTAGNFIGADRKCIFSNGLVFGETVVELKPNELLTFDIVDQPKDPELLGHLTLHRGQFALRANPDGTTTLTGRSWYTLHVRPLWYFDAWTRLITRQVHLRVMRHIKQLSETSA